MRNFVLVLATTAALGAMSAAAQAMPTVGSTDLGTPTAGRFIEKTAVVVTRRVVPSRKVCTTTRVGGRSVRRCVTR